ncbi:MAG: ThuA domain-containing protein [Verrucomicrobia bacterium]|nr:ThuA domain-containing protein [Verrucomicrobiota bacterium]
MKRLLFLLALLLTLPFPTAHAAKAPHVVFMIGEDEYKTWETLPEFAERDLKPAGYRVTIIHADAQDKNNWPGLTAALKDADLLFLSVRRRTPHTDQLDAVRAHLAAGKPLVGIRTACHAFALRPKDKLADEKLAVWQDFDPEVLGGHYTNHHPNGPTTIITLAPGAQGSAILKGVAVSKFTTIGSLYKVSPLVPDAKPLLLGSIPDQPAEPLAWTRLYGPKHARIFNTTLGHADDFQNPDFRRLLLNAVAWAGEK